MKKKEKVEGLSGDCPIHGAYNAGPEGKYDCPNCEFDKPLDVDPNIALNKAAADLMAMLSPTVREMLMETAVLTLHLPLWQLWCGLVQQAYDLGLYTTPILDPDWINRLPVMPTIYATVRCAEETCGKPFSPKWPGQKFCSDVCGTRVERRRLDRVAAERAGDVRRPLGKEAPGAVSSAMRYDTEPETDRLGGDAAKLG